MRAIVAPVVVTFAPNVRVFAVVVVLAAACVVCGVDAGARTAVTAVVVALLNRFHDFTTGVGVRGGSGEVSFCLVQSIACSW